MAFLKKKYMKKPINTTLKNLNFSVLPNNKSYALVF